MIERFFCINVHMYMCRFLVNVYLYIDCLWKSRGDDWDPITGNSTTVLNQFQSRTWISNVTCRCLFFMFSEFSEGERWLFVLLILVNWLPSLFKLSAAGYVVPLVNIMFTRVTPSILFSRHILIDASVQSQESKRSFICVFVICLFLRFSYCN